jgi:hypothetical protein
MDDGTCSLMHNAHYFVDLVNPFESWKPFEKIKLLL